MKAERRAVFFARLCAGVLVLAVWSFTVIYNTIYTGSTSTWVHIGAGIVLGSIFPGGFEAVKTMMLDRLKSGTSKSDQ